MVDEDEERRKCSEERGKEKKEKGRGIKTEKKKRKRWMSGKGKMIFERTKLVDDKRENGISDSVKLLHKITIRTHR